MKRAQSLHTGHQPHTHSHMQWRIKVVIGPYYLCEAPLPIMQNNLFKQQKIFVPCVKVLYYYIAEILHGTYWGRTGIHTPIEQ